MTWTQSRRGGRQTGAATRRPGGSVFKDLFREAEEREALPANDNVPQGLIPTFANDNNAPGQLKPPRSGPTEAGMGSLKLVRRPVIIHLHGSMYGRRIRESTRETEWARAEEYKAARVLSLRDEHLRTVRGGSRLAEQPRKVMVLEACEHYRNPAPVHRWQKKRELSEQTIREVRKLETVILELEREERRRFCCDEVDDAFLAKLAERMIRPTSGYSTFLRGVLGLVRRILKAANRRWKAKGGCPSPAFELGEEPKGRDIVVQPHNARRLVEAAMARGWVSVAAVLIFGFNEGPRRKEMFNLQWHNLDLERTHAVLRDVKARGNEIRDRHFDDLRPGTVSMLRSLQSVWGRTSGPVFLDDEGQPFSDAAAFGGYMNTRIRQLARELGLPDAHRITLHALRHTGASWDYKEGKDIEGTRQRWDWADWRTTQRYVHILRASTAEEVAAFWNTVWNLTHRTPD